MQENKKTFKQFICSPIGNINFFNFVLFNLCGYQRSNRIRYDSSNMLCYIYDKVQKSKLLKEREMLLLRLYEAKRHLDNFYDTMAIDYDFRGLIAVGYMNKFIKLGISTKLTGADGLYYLIMQELDKAIIKLSLIEISNKLDTVISNQNRLYDELYYINSKCDQMIESTIKQISRLDDIERNTELTNYCAGRIEKELEFQNFMLLYNSF